MCKVPGQSKLIMYGGYTQKDKEAGEYPDISFYILDIITKADGMTCEYVWSELKLIGDCSSPSGFPLPMAHHQMRFFSET